ncbi:MAG: 30S ribosome-binding factor RbfA [Parachlamydiaceae bacterium]
MSKKRVDRLNSLLKEVISDVIRKEVKNPHVNEFVTVTRVDITADLHYAKVYISVIGSETEKQETLAALNSAAGFIGINSSKKITLRYFPSLTFILDDSLEKQIRIEELLHKISDERKSREHESDLDPS